jgi:hypothetical protein
MGGNVWELTLEGANESAYVFYSAPTLEFTPGTLIENLAPGTVPTGTIGGTNNEVLTTDIDGHAAVQVTLAGGPRDFVRAQSAPPLLEEGFEANDGSFTVPAIGGTTEGTLWEWGQADSDNEFGLAIVDGNPPSQKCWAVGLGAFIATGDGTNEGYYAIPTTAYLRSRPIDLTGVTAASLSFAEAIDAEAGDVAEVYVIDATDAVIGGGPIYNATGGVLTSVNWTAANGGTPIALPAGAMGQTVRIEWRFSGAGTDFLGWYIDDVVVERN